MTKTDLITREEFLNKYAGHLNDNQLRAVQTVDGPILLLAVPGSGKTTVLVNRLGYMIYCKGIDPDKILTLTYTVAATRDMKNRYESIFGSGVGDNLEFRTINGICSKIINNFGKMIGKPPYELVTDSKVTGRILTDILVNNLSEYPTESDVSHGATLITYCKNMLLTEQEIDQLGKQENIPLTKIYRQYNNYLISNSLMDYDDQLVYAYRLLKRVPKLLEFYREKYRYICVDEAQDTSKIQHLIIGLLAGENGNLFMVGDEDQSIYGFRAAYPEALLDFEKNHPKAQVLIMDKNYRSKGRIVSVADKFIQGNIYRHKKHMVATRNAEDEIKYIELTGRASQYNYLAELARSVAESKKQTVADSMKQTEAEYQKQTAVLYRDNESAIPLIDILDRENIDYRIKGRDMSFFTSRVVTDITNIMNFALNPRDTDLFMRIYFKCETYLKKTQAMQLASISLERNIPVLDALSYVSDISPKVLKNCRSLKNNLKLMARDNPKKALGTIEHALGYGNYMKNNDINDNKLFTLKMLAYKEDSISGFLERLEYLHDMLGNKEWDYSCPFILSTIHSSKGLEYDQVYLMDVCNGVFPSQTTGMSKTADHQEKKVFEEERRLFYVGMTRAKDQLCIFKYKNKASCFVKEINKDAKGGNEKKDIKKTNDRSISYNIKAQTPKNFSSIKKEDYNFELIIGQRVVQKVYGSGTVIDVKLDVNGLAEFFEVRFDSGIEKKFLFPMAFAAGMKLED